MSKSFSGKPVTLAFTGDIFFSDKLYDYYENDGISGFLSGRIQNTLRDADLYIPNHEFVCSDRGTKADYQTFTFRAPAKREKLFQELGADVITLANNHALDYGTDALLDTFSLIHTLGMEYVGAGNDLEEALTPAVKRVRGKSFAIFGTTRFVPNGDWYAAAGHPGVLTSYESTDYFPMICDAIEKAKRENDFVIVYAHMGIEKQTSVEEFQKIIAHGYVDAGADLVVACHPHRLQGMEFYRGRLIAYSLGNFLFCNYHSDTMVLTVSVREDNSVDARILPCSSESYKTKDLTGDDAERLYRFIEDISFNITIDENGTITEKK